MTGFGILSGEERAVMLAVRLGGTLHAIPIETVEEVLPSLPVESIPQIPDFVLGVVSVRGHLIPVLDGAARLGLKNVTTVEDPHLVCLRLPTGLIGVQVDEAIDLLELPRRIDLPMEALGAAPGFIRGVVEHEGEVVRVLNPFSLLLPHEAQALGRIPRTP